MGNVNVIKTVDRFLGPIICLILSIFSRGGRSGKMQYKKILFIQLWGIGETILTLPAVSSVTKKYRKSVISVLATERNKDIYLSSGLSLNVITANLKVLSIIKLMLLNFKKYDLVIDMEEYLNISSIIAFFIGKKRMGFHGRARSLLYNKTAAYNDNQHVVDTFLGLAGLLEVYCSNKDIIKLEYTNQDKGKIGALLKKIPKKLKLIGIVTGAAESAKSRMWPYFNDLCRELDRGYSLVFIGDENEKEVNSRIADNLKNAIDTTGKLSLRELFCLIDRLNLLITNDTGPLHIASAQNTKTIGLFGPNTPLRFGPLAKGSIAIYHKGSCEFSPCINVHKGEVPDCLYPKKSRDYQKCMKAIKVKEVIEAVEKLS